MWVVGHGWHVGLAVRRDEVRADLWSEAHDFGAFEHVEVGWGDGDFYPAERGTVALALRAAVASASSVLHVAAFNGDVAEFFAGAPVVELRLTPAAFDAVCRFIAAAYAREPSAQPLGAGLYGASRFYRARQPYRVFDNSNNWAARALRAGGVPVSPGLSLTAGSVFAQVEPLGTVRRSKNTVN
ncbi:MAG: DUF2459 domain-containing protein [Candidatus Rokubacteria bacterium]|nr:DUF2459 domain-containing protein [Candidatus Rokubacteria bacterium]